MAEWQAMAQGEQAEPQSSAERAEGDAQASSASGEATTQGSTEMQESGGSADSAEGTSAEGKGQGESQTSGSADAPADAGEQSTPAGSEEQSAEAEQANGDEQATDTSSGEDEDATTDAQAEFTPEESKPADAADTPEKSDEDKDQTDTPEKLDEVPMVALDQTQVVDGVAVTVKAPDGSFPQGATLSVSKVPAPEQEKVDEAVDAARASANDAEANVAASYTFDIKVLDAEGKEVQPADDHTVEVSFSLPQVADENLTTSVYHVEEQENTEQLSVEKLKATEDEQRQIVTTESDGFSYYTVEFTYGTLRYVLNGYEPVRLTDILGAVGLTGEPQAVLVSNLELFSASNETGEWIVVALQPFSTQEWMKVAIAGIEYQIDVTDDFVAQGTQVNYNGQTLLNGGTYVVSGTRKTSSRITIAGDVVIVLEDSYLLECGGINVLNGASLTVEGHEFDEALDLVSVGKIHAKTEKVWADKDNRDGLRPNSVTVHLLADGADTGIQLELSEATNWNGTFEDVVQKKNGEPIIYTVSQNEVAGYATPVTGDAAAGFVITNTYEPQGEPTPGSEPDPETTQVSVRKVWGDEVGKRPTTVIIRLLANDSETGQSVELSEANDWTGTFEGLAAKSGEEPIVYTVAEEEVEDYEATIDGDAATGFTITNVYDSGSTSSRSPTKVPSATVTTTRTSTPTTGDDSSPVASLLMVAAFGLIAAGMRRRHSL